MRLYETAAHVLVLSSFPLYVQEFDDLICFCSLSIFLYLISHLVGTVCNHPEWPRSLVRQGRQQSSLYTIMLVVYSWAAGVTCMNGMMNIAVVFITSTQRRAVHPSPHFMYPIAWRFSTAFRPPHLLVNMM